MPSSEIIAMVAKSGVFALLFTMLLVYLLKQNDRREGRYIKTIDTLTQALGQLEEITKEVRLIKKIVTANVVSSPCDYRYTNVNKAKSLSPGMAKEAG